MEKVSKNNSEARVEVELVNFHIRKDISWNFNSLTCSL